MHRELISNGKRLWGLSLAIRSSYFLLICRPQFGNLIKAIQFNPSIPGRNASSAHLGERMYHALHPELGFSGHSQYPALLPVYQFSHWNLASRQTPFPHLHISRLPMQSWSPYGCWRRDLSRGTIVFHAKNKLAQPCELKRTALARRMPWLHFRGPCHPVHRPGGIQLRLAWSLFLWIRQPAFL